MPVQLPIQPAKLFMEQPMEHQMESPILPTSSIKKAWPLQIGTRTGARTGLSIKSPRPMLLPAI